MNANTNCHRIAFVLLVSIFVIIEAIEPDLFKLAERQGLSPEESHSLLRLKNAVSRLKRQQATPAPKSDRTPKQYVPTRDQPPECGINGRSESSSGSKTNQMDWPWIVSLLDQQFLSPFCGGVLLNKNYVLTAAHCVKGRSASAFTVRLGEFDFSTPNETETKDYAVDKVEYHSEYDAATQQNDIALVRLKIPVTYTNFVRPICLPSTTTSTRTNQTSFVAGWGIVSYGGQTSDVLLEVSVPIWELENCRVHYVPPVFDTNICAAGYEGNRDSCTGDSGGPLVIQDKNGRWVNIGVVSWGIGCGFKEKPGVYTSVVSFLDWIRRKMPDAII